MRVLITGGGGLIGQAIAKAHLAIGHEVFIFDNKSNKFNDYSNLVGTDISNKSISEILEIENFDIISHQAASVGVGESQYNFTKYTENNIQFTAELLQAILSSKKFPKRLILASSMGPYGEGTYECLNNIDSCDLFCEKVSIESRNLKCSYCEELLTPVAISEGDQRNPQSIYAITKFTQEEMFRVFADTYNVKTVALRYFSVYGSECNPNNPFTGVLSIIGNKIINSDKVELFEDGKQTRDLIHADDCASAHVKASLIELENNFEAFNTATGKSISMAYVAEKMIKIIDSSKKLVFNNQIRKGDIKNSYANVTKIKNLLNWESKIDLDKSIEEYSFFLIKNWDKFKTKDTCKEEQDKLTNLNLIK